MRAETRERVGRQRHISERRQERELQRERDTK